jgi:hypothetical protein
VAKFIGSGKSEAAKTELANVQTAVTAAMADAKVGTITGKVGICSTDGIIDTTTNLTIAPFISGGLLKINGTYTVATDGGVTQTAYP